MRTKWFEQLSADKQTGKITKEVILPLFERWVTRRHGSMSFHLTQIMTRHGCFNSYLYQIGKAASDRCAHCGIARDTLSHTWEECGSWTEERKLLRMKLNVGSVTIKSAIEEMLAGPEEWQAVVHYADRVLLKKEDMERERQGQPGAIRRL
ncbi:uncharacterized protein LOC109861566 [Pseudomyrmex gracilis]|uniref:uncharacterized protein LOC109861566 n=1 Tax=Pseudomyrmex gracilis TaxID=219809 RepID=UPI0009959BF8|nr:uncharacterized protein LOC109861566 [Pseudomyrmex gracilis]